MANVFKVWTEDGCVNTVLARKMDINTNGDLAFHYKGDIKEAYTAGHWLRAYLYQEEDDD